MSYPLRRYLLDQSRGKARDYKPHWYAVTFNNPAALAVNATATATVDLDTDAPWLFLSVLEEDQEDPAVRFTFNGLIMVRFGGQGGKAWARSDCHIGNVCGARPTPYYLPAPALLSAGSQLHVTLTNLQAGQATSAGLTFIFGGLKVYGWGGRP